MTTCCLRECSTKDPQWSRSTARSSMQPTRTSLRSPWSGKSARARAPRTRRRGERALASSDDQRLRQPFPMPSRPIPCTVCPPRWASPDETHRTPAVAALAISQTSRNGQNHGSGRRAAPRAAAPCSHSLRNRTRPPTRKGRRAPTLDPCASLAPQPLCDLSGRGSAEVMTARSDGGRAGGATKRHRRLSKHATLSLLVLLLCLC